VSPSLATASTETTAAAIARARYGSFSSRVDVEDQQHQRQRHDERLREQAQRVDANRDDPPAGLPRAARVARLQVRQHGQEIEQARELVAPLGHPDDRLDAQRVHGEEQRRGAGPQGDRARARGWQAERKESAREEVDQRRRDGVQHDVREVIARGVHPPERVVDAEGEPRHRDPVAHDGVRERPVDLGPAEAAIPGIGQEVAVVVPEDEAVLERGREDRQRNGRDGERRDPARR